MMCNCINHINLYFWNNRWWMILFLVGGSILFFRDLQMLAFLIRYAVWIKHYKNVHLNSNLITCAHMFFLFDFVGIVHSYTVWCYYRSCSSYHWGTASNTWGMNKLLLTYNLNNFDSHVHIYIYIYIYFMCFDFTNRTHIVVIHIGLDIVYFRLHLMTIVLAYLLTHLCHLRSVLWFMYT